MPQGSSPGIEEARIKVAYANRKHTIPKGRYSFFNEANLFIVQERERQFLALLKQYGFASLHAKSILEIGCGAGFWLREFIKWGARPENLTGVELLDHRVAEAVRLCPEAVRVECRNAAKLSFPDAEFDLVFQSMAFSSILDQGLKQQVASEMSRVVKPDGLILWYDFHINNPRNPDVRGVKKREIQRLFSGCSIRLRRLTLAPPLVRMIAPSSWMLSSLLARIPFLCTHYLGVIRKGASILVFAELPWLLLSSV